MKTIWKYILRNESNFIDIPVDFETLSIVTQRNQVVLYCLVNPDNERVKTRFDVVGTGWELPDNFYDDRLYLGSVTTHEDTYVWHVFEVIE